MEIVTKKNAYWGTLIIPQNKRFTVPDEIGIGLVARGMAEKISPEIVKELKPKEPTPPEILEDPKKKGKK